MKILIVRFSSIGDIVLTTPVIRCLKQQTHSEIHFLTFKKFSSVVEHNPYIDRLITVNSSVREVVKELRRQKYGLIVDLHRNIRTTGLKTMLLRPSVSFPKLNIRKYLLVRAGINLMPDIHIVERYMKTVKRLGVNYDAKGLDYFLDPDGHPKARKLTDTFPDGFVAIVMGGRYYTKIYPEDYVSELINSIDTPVILMGGVEDFGRGERVVESTEGRMVFNACGKFSLNDSAYIISCARAVITNDTGLMHIAAAFHRKIISIWGNTVPAFGMTPLLPEGMQNHSKIVEVNDVRCRPCSKLGFSRCPKTHFRCMKEIKPGSVAEELEAMLQN